MTLIVVLVTLTAAVLFGLSTVLEQRSTKQVSRRGALSPRLLLDLARRRLWLAALILSSTSPGSQCISR